MTDEMRQVQYLSKVCDMIQRSMNQPSRRAEIEEEIPYQECDLCHEEVESSDLSSIEFRKASIDVCSHCLINLPDEYPVDEDQFRGDR